MESAEQEHSTSEPVAAGPVDHGPSVPRARQRLSLGMEQAQAAWAVASLMATGSSRLDAVDERWD